MPSDGSRTVCPRTAMISVVWPTVCAAIVAPSCEPHAIRCPSSFTDATQLPVASTAKPNTCSDSVSGSESTGIARTNVWVTEPSAGGS